MILSAAAKLNDLDQILLALSKKIGDFVPFIGGPEHAHILIPIIESLCSAEETVIRVNAATSTCKILAQLDDSNSSCATAYLGLLKRLSSEDSGESFYARASACLFVDEVFRVVGNASEKATVMEIYTKLCADEVLIVKRNAASIFPKIVKYADVSSACGEFFALFKAFLSSDEHSTVKVIALEGILSYCKLLQKLNCIGNIANDLVQCLKSAAEDTSWRIRLAIVKNFGEVSSLFPTDAVSAELFPCLVHLLQDSEPEVRINACASALPFLSMLGPDAFLLEVVPTAAQLTEDSFPNVRKIVAEMCVSIALELGTDAVGQHVADLVLKCIGDESPIVRLRVVSKLDLIAQKVPSLCTRLTPAIVAAQKDTAWRVRQHWCHVMPGLAKHMGTSYFSENLLSLYLELFKDGVSDVRIAVSESLEGMISATSSAWVYENIFPTIKSLSTGDYLLRMTMLDALKHLLRGEISERFRGEALALVLSTTSDTVPNVKISTAKVLTLVCERSGDDSASNRALIKPALMELEGDKDKDVKYFAVEGLKLCA
jgi:serine/threonine-protein phosphatase 2A regulatory subunit A